MNRLILFSTIALLATACNNRSKDLSAVLRNYKEHIEFSNQVDLDRIRFLMDKCGADTIVLLYKETFLSNHKIGQRAVLKIENTKTPTEINSLYKIYGDSLLACSLNRYIDKEIELIQIEDTKSLTLSELKIISQTNLILLEKKMRDDIAASIAIDCP